MTELVNTRINQRWDLLLPPHRAERAEWWDGWEKERLAALYDTIRPGDVIYDVGSEEGDLPALFADWCWSTDVYTCYGCGANYNRVTFAEVYGVCQNRNCGTSIKEESRRRGGVVLFEPNPKVWPNIKLIFQGNGFRPLDCYVGFAGDRTTLDFDLEARRSDDPELWPECAYGPVIRDHGFCNLSERPDIPSITIDDHSASRGLIPNIITIDTEGSELRVLKGARRVLQERRPIVFVSVHPTFMLEMYADTPEDLQHYMTECRYTSELLAIDHEEHWKYTPLGAT